MADATALFDPGCCPRLIVKIGSSLLVEEGRLREAWLASVIADVLARRAAGQEVVIVSSGAVALGARLLDLPERGRRSLEDAQAAAAAGQIALSQAYAAGFAAHGVVAAQMLVTLDDFEDRRRFLNAAATLDRLLKLGAVPVVNENDSVATAEIRFGDNDRLAARVAQGAAAGGVILLSDVEGLFTADPRDDPAATLVPVVEALDARIEAMAGAGSGSGLGSGGMTSKLQAARIALAAGTHLAIASGKRDRPLSAFAADRRGTVFVATGRLQARKAWLAGRMTVAGRLHVDAGAAAALAEGRSLLAAGIVAVEGGFERGDAVEVVGPSGAIGQGLAAYDATEAGAIRGTRREDQAAILGYAPRAAVIHRDHLVLR